MAFCGDAGSRAGGRTAGDAARAEGIRGDAGKVGSQRCSRDCATDAAGLVPAGALQIDERARDPNPADSAEAGAIEASRRGEQSARDPARLWAEGWQDDGTQVCGSDRGACGGPSAPPGDRQGTAGGASGAAEGVGSFREAGTQDGALRRAGTAADVDAGGPAPRVPGLCQPRAPPRPGPNLQTGGGPFSGT